MTMEALSCAERRSGQVGNAAARNETNWCSSRESGADAALMLLLATWTGAQRTVLPAASRLLCCPAPCRRPAPRPWHDHHSSEYSCNTHHCHPLPSRQPAAALLHLLARFSRALVVWLEAMPQAHLAARACGRARGLAEAPGQPLHPHSTDNCQQVASQLHQSHLDPAIAALVGCGGTQPLAAAGHGAARLVVHSCMVAWVALQQLMPVRLNRSALLELGCENPEPQLPCIETRPARSPVKHGIGVFSWLHQDGQGAHRALLHTRSREGQVCQLGNAVRARDGALVLGHTTLKSHNKIAASSAGLVYNGTHHHGWLVGGVAGAHAVFEAGGNGQAGEHSSNRLCSGIGGGLPARQTDADSLSFTHQ